MKSITKQSNGWFLSCIFAIPLRSIIWQKCNLKTTVYRGVRESMNRYINPHFNIKIDFPETWGFRYWGNRTNKLTFPERYQTAFDDLPTELSGEKELLSARSKIRRNSLTGTVLYIISLYRPNGFSLLEHRVGFETDLKREFKIHSIAGVEIQSLLLEEQAEDYICYSLMYCWEYSENIWLFCGIRSDALEGFEEVKEIIGQVSSIKNL
jgi:hypothetical protein